jgi:Ca2+-binding RTX toxin-like protein
MDRIYAGEGHDHVDGGYGNDEIRGDSGNDTLLGGFGADTVIGATGNDVITGAAWGDVLFGGAGNDFLNGGFGFDRLNGGSGADQFYHLGIYDHGSDWIQDYRAAEGDVMVFGGAAKRTDFMISLAQTPGAGQAQIDEAFVIHIPTAQIVWALVDGAGQSELNLRAGGQVFDLLA